MRDAAQLRFGVLGPLEVLHLGTLCTPTARKQRALLALLLLHRNEPMGTATLIDELWGHRPPRSANAALQVYVTAIRRALSGGHATVDPRSHPVLQTCPSGYVIRVETGQLDLAQARDLCARGRRAIASGSCEGAAELFGQALSLWRGPALADLRQIDALAHHASLLDEEWLALRQDMIDTYLCLGRGPDVTAEVSRLCQRYPLREPFHQQLMLALYQAGRRADALHVYTTAYRTMMDEIGIEPGPGLRRIQRAILDGADPLECSHACHLRGPL